MRPSTHVLGRRATCSSCQRRRFSPSTKIVAESFVEWDFHVDGCSTFRNESSYYGNISEARAKDATCGKAGSPHTIVLQNAMYWKCFNASPKNLIEMPGCRNSKGTTRSSYQKHHPSEDRLSPLLQCVINGSKLKIFETFTSDGCATSHT